MNSSMVAHLILSLMLMGVLLVVFLKVSLGFMDWLPMPDILVIGGFVLLAMLAISSAEKAESGDGHARDIAVAYAQRLGQTLKGDMICTATMLTAVTGAYRCSAAVEPHGHLVTLLCDDTRCVVPTP